MSHTKSTGCPRCGALPPAGTPDQPCPACLMSGALGGPEDETLSLATGFVPSPPAPADFPCTFGGYRLLSSLGSGGMGTVYEAEEVSTGRRVALKMLARQLDSPEMRRRFLREGRLAAGVSHPNSLYIFGSEEVNATPVITMEIAGGGTLGDRLKKSGPLPSKEAVDAILDVVAGLEAAVGAGVLHRDIKPSNCFVDPDGRVKIGDFGLSVSTLAKEDSYITATGVIMGTPAYAAPEQLRGDSLDLRADIYSVGATLYSLLSGRAPFSGKNAVQVVANAVNKEPQPLHEFCKELPPGLERVISRCLAKEPQQRHADYPALRAALLPFSSREPEPALLTIRAAAGWVDYLIAFLVPYIVLVLAVGNDEFHLRFFMDRTLYSARYYLTLLAFGFLYFTLVEGLWGAGIGKRLKGLRVMRRNGRVPGMGRAFLRILIPILSIEVVRLPLLLTLMSATEIDAMTTSEVVIFSAATALCPWIPVLLMLRAGPDNGFATFWDLASGTRVVMKGEALPRPAMAVEEAAQSQPAPPVFLGPYEIISEIIPGKWLLAGDPVLRRQVWLLSQDSGSLSRTRRDLARPGRPRWLQSVEAGEATWDAFEASPGVAFTSLVQVEEKVPWGTLRHWLHDLASELWAATSDGTLPSRLSLDHVWLTSRGQAILLDTPWPTQGTAGEAIAVSDVRGQQRFLDQVAACVEETSLPLHARPILENLAQGKFPKLSFLTGTLRGVLDRLSEVSRGVRAGSIFMLPFYVGIMAFVGAFHTADWLYRIIGDSIGALAMTTLLLVLLGSALAQLLEVPLRTTAGYSIFRLAVVNAQGQPARPGQLLLRWAMAWLPLLVPLSLVALLMSRSGAAAVTTALVLILVWMAGGVHAAFHPHRGLHDRLAGTWVVRR